MSSSPLNSGAGKPTADRRDRSETPLSHHAGSADANSLSLSQALIITAGIAGLIGLMGGTVMRFSLSNSTNARFLSPLQTFPNLSSWTPELPQRTSDNHYLPGGTDTYENNVSKVETSQSLEGVTDPTPNASDALNSGSKGLIDIATFDTFADRAASEKNATDPWEVLQEGPRLGRSDPADTDNFYSEEYVEERTSSADDRYDAQSESSVYPQSSVLRDIGETAPDTSGYSSSGYDTVETPDLEGGVSLEENGSEESSAYSDIESSEGAYYSDEPW
ncbi:MAG: hypothetical protein AAFO06_02845 [Cyanobacteria bacterium J06597_16]